MLKVLFGTLGVPQYQDLLVMRIKASVASAIYASHSHERSADLKKICNYLETVQGG